MEHKKKRRRAAAATAAGEENNRVQCTRFSDEQVKLMESVFREATKLEPRKKLELAKDIGLNPRQVSIWFQNKRARWKSKQLESEFRVLKHDFDALNIQFQSLKKENHSLLQQIERLRNELTEKNNYDDESSCRGLWSEEDEDEEEDKSRVEKYLRRNQEILGFLNMDHSDEEHGAGDPNGTSLASPEKNWCDIPTAGAGFLDDDRPCSPSTWWN